jgi:hypothetical protein
MGQRARTLGLVVLTQRPIRIHTVEDLAPALRDLSERPGELYRLEGTHLQAAEEGERRQEEQDGDDGDQTRHPICAGGAEGGDEGEDEHACVKPKACQTIGAL